MNESEFIEENLYSKMFMKNERKGFKFCYIPAIINYIGSVLSIPIIWTLLSMIFFRERPPRQRGGLFRWGKERVERYILDKFH